MLSNCNVGTKLVLKMGDRQSFLFSIVCSLDRQDSDGVIVSSRLYPEVVFCFAIAKLFCLFLVCFIDGWWQVLVVRAGPLYPCWGVLLPGRPPSGPDWRN